MAASVLIIGAGMAGLSAAKTLANSGLKVTIFDKGRVVGGRVATRTRDGLFNFGAQYIPSTALAQDSFMALMMSRSVSNLVSGWGEKNSEGPVSKSTLQDMATTSRGTATDFDYLKSFNGMNGFIFQPSMAAFPRALATDISTLGVTVSTSKQVTALSKSPPLSRWNVQFLNGSTRNAIDGTWPLNTVPPDNTAPCVETCFFDAVVLAIPSPQAIALLKEISHPFCLHMGGSPSAAPVTWDPCWSVMLKMNTSPPNTDMIFKAGNIRWASCEESRKKFPPDPTSCSSWTLLASPDFTRRHLESTPVEVTRLLVSEFADRVKIPVEEVTFARAHRWRYSFVTKALGVSHLWDPQGKLGVCGDWCVGSTVDAAVESGHAVALSVLRDMAVVR